MPFTRFAEPDPASKPEGGRTPNAWFAIDASQPLAFFAGVWVAQWPSVRKVREGLTSNDLYAFLTTEPNGVVAPVHQKAMPVILTTEADVETWLTEPWETAKALQRPLLNGRLFTCRSWAALVQLRPRQLPDISYCQLRGAGYGNRGSDGADGPHRRSLR